MSDASWVLVGVSSFALGCLATAVVLRALGGGDARASAPEAASVRASANDNGGGEDDDDDDESSSDGGGGGGGSMFDSMREQKMVLVVRTDLKMGKGKVCAQVGHATLGAFRRAQRHAPAAVRAWSIFGQAKIALKCPSEHELLELQHNAHEAGLPHYLVQDAGRTQVDPGTLTVLAIGPGPVDVIDAVTGHLKLY